MQDRNKLTDKINTDTDNSGAAGFDAAAPGSDRFLDALSDADKVITESIKRKEAQEAIAQTDREVAELSRMRKMASREGIPADTISPSDTNGSVSTKSLSKDTEDPSGHAHARAGRGSGSSKPEKPRRVAFKALIVFIAAAAICAVIYLIWKYTPTSSRMSYSEYFGQMEDNEAAIILQDKNLADRALVSDSGALYLPYDLVRSDINERFFWDGDRSEMLFTTPLQTYEIPINSTSYSVIDGALTSDPTSEASFDEIIILRDDTGSHTSGAGTPSILNNSDDHEDDGYYSSGSEAVTYDSSSDSSSDSPDNQGSVVSADESAANLYVSLNFIQNYTDISYVFSKDSQHVYIRNVWGDTLTCEASKDSAVRYQGNIKSPILTDLDKGDMVTILGQSRHWLRVLTEDGYIGYVKSNRMTDPETTSVQHAGSGSGLPEYTTLAYDETVSLVWHNITTEDGNSDFDDATQSMSGVNVISPTWFSLTDNDGNVESLGTKAYVNKAHARNLKVWGLVDDFSSDMDTSQVLASTTARRRCIGQLVDYAQALGLDGINLDFEYMEETDALSYTQFVRELSIACRRAQLVLSVDLVPPFDFNSYLNRVEIATVSDYLITMGYDEHYAGSSEAGSVASLSYEETAIQTLIDMGISEKKLISAVPFYTRIWYTSTGTDGTMYVNSEVLSMDSVSATLESWHLTPVWDPDTCQNYVGWYADDGVFCQIWIEDAESLQRKLLLVPKYQLGGAAIWMLGFETDSIWTTVEDSLSKTQDEAVTLETSLEEEEDARVASQSASAQAQTEIAETETDAA